jgi:hypothetical protein
MLIDRNASTIIKTKITWNDQIKDCLIAAVGIALLMPFLVIFLQLNKGIIDAFASFSPANGRVLGLDGADTYGIGAIILSVSYLFIIG